MNGWLIVNEYLNTDKFAELTDLFMSAAKVKGIKLTKYTNADFILNTADETIMSTAFSYGMPDFVIFYDKDITLAKALERKGLKLFNSAKAIKICDSKYLTYEALTGSSVRIPKTYRVPFTYENIGISRDGAEKFVRQIENELIYPIIIKECYSSFGMGVHIASNREEAVNLISEFGNKECVVQEYIKTQDAQSGSCDVRIQMVGDRCVAAMKRENDYDFRSNLTNGGVMKEYAPSEDDIKMALEVMKYIDLDFAGIDIMHDSNGNPVFCEANSNAHFANLCSLTGINAAEYMFEYIKDRV